MKNGKIAFEGIVVNGLGEGSYFMSIQHYKNEIKKKLGFTAYPGTLNIKFKKNHSGFIKKITPIKITGFRKDGKIFFGAKCYKAEIKNVKGSIIIPEINKHKKNIMEFIAPIHIKSKLKIRNGNKIKIRLL